MYSSTNNSNVNPFLPSPFHHYHHDPLTDYSSHQLVSDPPIAKKRSTRRTDRHSKIRTGQGVRDRRVRLSVGIARKFFDLQETLGFDKASKTLDWLLMKSKKDIMELKNTTQVLCSFPSTSCECQHVVSGETTAAEAMYTQMIMKEKSRKESREKARERAKERTREKLLMNQIRSSSCEFGIYEKSRNEDQETDKLNQPQQQQQQQNQPPFACYNYEQNFVASTTNDAMSSIIRNNNNCYLLPTLPQYWDNISDALKCSSFYDMINTNLSTELQIYDGIPYWEAHNNQINLH